MIYASKQILRQGHVIPLQTSDKINVVLVRGNFRQEMILDVINYSNYSFLVIKKTDIIDLPNGEYRLILEDNYETLINIES